MENLWPQDLKTQTLRSVIIDRGNSTEYHMLLTVTVEIVLNITCYLLSLVFLFTVVGYPKERLPLHIQGKK